MAVKQDFTSLNTAIKDRESSEIIESNENSKTTHIDPIRLEVQKFKLFQKETKGKLKN